MRTIARFTLAAVFAVACSASDDGAQPVDGADADAAGTPAVAARDACTLITKAEADAILGSSFEPQSREASGERSVCDYVPAVGPAGQAYQGFTLEVYWTGGEEAIAIGRRAAGGATDAAGGSSDSIAAGVMGLTRVDGVGDEAYFSGRTMSYVRKGDVTLQFQLGGLDAPTPDHLRRLAAAALARIPG